MMRRRSVAGLTMAALALGLVACVPEVPEVTPDPETDNIEPVLDEPRLQAVLEDVEAHIAEADEAADPELLESRMDDPALRVRASEYRLAEATAGSDAATEPRALSTQSQVSIVAATQEWPRIILVVTEIPDGANLPLLIGLRQDAPRDPYQMFSWTQLLPGITMPETEVPEIGSSPVAGDSEDFFLPPDEALKQYADVLSNGSDSEFAAHFADDVFREAVQSEVDNLAEGVEESGAFRHATVPGEDPIVAMRTAAGGVIVIGDLSTRYRFTKTEEDGEMEVGGQLAQLSDSDGEVNENLRGIYDVMVALYVPAPSEDAEVTVLGVERVLQRVTEE